MGTLKNLVIAVTGTFAHETSQLRKWIEANGGRYLPSVRKGLTHLIAGEDAWRNSSDAVQSANALGAFVVSYDWLEDSLQKKRKIAEKRYTWEHKWQERRQRKKLKRLGLLADAKKFNDGCEEAKKATGTGTSKSRSRVVVRKPKPSKSFFFADVVETKFVSAADDLKRRREEREAAKAKKADEEAAKEKDMEHENAIRATSSAPSNTSPASLISTSSHTLSTSSSPCASLAPGSQAKKTSLKDLYHYYLDTTGFEYKITLTRCNLRQNKITRYRLSILESHTKPNVYATLVEFFPPGAGGTLTSGKGEDACMQAILDFTSAFHDNAGKDEDEEDDPSLPCLPPLVEEEVPHPEATRLSSLLQSPVPSPTEKFRTLLAPLNSPFPAAWRAFRHAFRDLTLLTWEERFDVSKTLYKTRAARLGIEPFVYIRPKPGLPLGLRVQENGVGLYQNPPALVRNKDGEIVSASARDAETEKAASTQSFHSSASSSSSPSSSSPSPSTPPGQSWRKDDDETYTYNAHSLPSLAHPLGAGIIGTAILRDAEEARKKAEAADAAQQLASASASSAQSEKNVGKVKKPNFSRPLFNGVMGRPTVDAWGRYKRTGGGGGGGARAVVSGQAMNGGSGAGMAGVVKRPSRAFPSERRGL